MGVKTSPLKTIDQNNVDRATVFLNNLFTIQFKPLLVNLIADYIFSDVTDRFDKIALDYDIFLATYRNLNLIFEWNIFDGNIY